MHVTPVQPSSRRRPTLIVNALTSRASTSAVAIVTAIALGAVAEAATINVPSPTAPTITVAINIAAEGDEIVVGPGTYFESISLSGKTLSIRSSGGPEVTVIDGLGQFKSVIRIISGEGPATLIEGFTIRNGQATGAAPNDRGGGIYCNLTSPTIRDCIIEGNVGIVGGGFYANGGAPKLEACVFVGNEAVTSAGDGGAMYLNNTTLSMTDCEFVGNQSDRFGGAIRSAGSTAITALRCHFAANVAANNGGVIDVGAGAAAHVFQSCRFVGNVSGVLGGAVQLANATGPTHQFLNCLFRGNQAQGGGGAMHVGTNAVLINCTLAQNSSGVNGGAVLTAASAVATVRNSIVWDNAPNGLVGAVVATFTCHQSPLAGQGNFVMDPLFVDAASGDLRLDDGSPCVDAGNTQLLPASLDVDLLGQPRAVNVRDMPTGIAAFGYFIDLGPFEFPAPASVPACVGDLNLDGVVDGADLGLLLTAWGLCR